MKKFAVIDIGSNSVRLMLVADGKVLYKTLNTTRLGEGIAIRPLLKPEAISRTADAVAQFYQKAKSDGVNEIYAFATAAVRSAENREDFLAAVRNRCPLDVEIVSGEEEATLGIVGALGEEDGALIDVGGASTELVVQKDQKLIYKKSIDVGIVRLKDECGRDKTRLLATANSRVREYGNIPMLSRVYAIGGTATTLAALSLGLDAYDSNKVTGARISYAQMRDLSEKLLQMSVEEIAALPCVSKGREDVLAGGAVWLTTIMQTFAIEHLIVSDKDNLEGYAIKKGLL